MKLQIQDINACHPSAPLGSAPAIKGMNLQINSGEQIALIGPSGAGKTTLLQVLSCTLKPQQGSITLGGQNPWHLSKRKLQKLRGQLIVAPQVPPLPPRQRVITSVLAGRLPAMSLLQSLKSLFYPVDIPAAHMALSKLDLPEKIFERVDRLSGGERQRVGLARLFVSPAKLWLVDEPLSALDPTRARLAMSALTDSAQEKGISLICTLHQVDMALAFFKRIIGLRDGKIVFDLPTEQVTPAMLKSLYAQYEHELLGQPDRELIEKQFERTTPTVVVNNCR
ncbi:MAG: ATP-binding cassette domain-containing protein [Limnobacter sp.]|uniref:phosphonate ABC transporter ATP-binding protein n=1 Tax=Limnobacter sp. TaxID=2003368 RepID=UPI0022C9F95A|nr:ATP-binding cassette domain-containing protein [Limnobacter sp.]MCZ8014843.1 ATP-binding cassette domain-containing protein [Limnobacter sp.]